MFKFFPVFQMQRFSKKFKKYECERTCSRISDCASTVTCIATQNYCQYVRQVLNRNTNKFEAGKEVILLLKPTVAHTCHILSNKLD